jgi:hypothetical protein
MFYNPIHFIRCLILCLAGYAICIPLVPFTVLGEDTKSPSAAVPKIDVRPFNALETLARINVDHNAAAE